jgi:hypothetical protein
LTLMPRRASAAATRASMPTAASDDATRRVIQAQRYSAARPSRWASASASTTVVPSSSAMVATGATSRTVPAGTEAKT